MRVGILTSSRADFGIYLPLLKALRADSYFELEIIAFGTHLSSFYGKTVNEITKAGFEVKYTVESMLLTDSANAVATTIGLTNLKFAEFWKNNKDSFDLIFCLGDRYEMFAAVTAGVPFQIRFAHIHGGETTLGAIDNVFRHAISLMSSYHFSSTDIYADRIRKIIGTEKDVYNVGALGLDNLKEIALLTVDGFKEKWSIDLSIQTILITFHPETVDQDNNEHYADELVKTIENLLGHYQVLITMPNADTAGNTIRECFIKNFSNNRKVFLVENLGTQSYFSAMNLCTFLLGNTSSGIIEAASFGKYVINVGDRQKGRQAGNNVLNCAINRSEILDTVRKIENSPKWDPSNNIYYKAGAALSIISILKSHQDNI